MAKRLKPADELPHFETTEEFAEFIETHDTSRIWDKLKPARPLKMPPEQIEAIKQRHAAQKAAISIRLDRDQIAAARKIAAKKSIGYQTQLRMWIAEGIRRESGR
ncbi:MAG TPA: CopG family antitoxin [Bryobacteraceae bacterium]|nr:CopG family antitoxin [Bryobacteraceae bacterium]